jgi:hypothetical protein
MAPARISLAEALFSFIKTNTFPFSNCLLVANVLSIFPFYFFGENYQCLSINSSSAIAIALPCNHHHYLASITVILPLLLSLAKLP